MMGERNNWRFSWAIGIGIFLAACNAALAQLTFDETNVKFSPKPEDRNALGEFAFKNTGTKTVTITKLKTDCGCTTASLAKKTYVPGESGRIVTIFDFGSRIGPYRKSVVVETDEPGSKPILLAMAGHIPEILDPQPYRVVWKVGEAPEVKTVRLPSDYGANPVEVYSTNKNFDVELKEEGGTPVLEVRPQDTRQQVRAFIQVRTDFPGDTPRWVAVPVQILE